jgi:hypothetical protein
VNVVMNLRVLVPHSYIVYNQQPLFTTYYGIYFMTNEFQPMGHHQCHKIVCLFTSI